MVEVSTALFFGSLGITGVVLVLLARIAKEENTGPSTHAPEEEENDES